MILCSQGGVCMNLVQEYLSLATEVVSFEAYGNKKVVNAYKRQATRMRKIASELNKSFQIKRRFLQVALSLNSEDFSLGCTPHFGGYEL